MEKRWWATDQFLLPQAEEQLTQEDGVKGTDFSKSQKLMSTFSVK